MKYRIKLIKRRTVTGEHTFEVSSISGAKSLINWHSKTNYFEYYGSVPTAWYGVYSLN